jgi:hypothetical protein
MSDLGGVDGDGFEERRARLAKVCSEKSDEVVAASLVDLVVEMLRAGDTTATVIGCTAVMVGDIRAGERLRMKGAS